MRILVLAFLILFSVNCFCQKNFQWYQKDKTKIEIKAINDFEKLEITNSKTKKTQLITDIETSITDKITYVAIDDYNFDGYTDFALYRTDDGMGVYTIFQIFIYNSRDNQFNKLKIPADSNPDCDEFCDIQVNKKKKILQSSCRGGAKWHTDIWKFDKNKNLILVKQ